MTMGGGRLVADIGGTNARFALSVSGEPPREERTLRTGDFPSVIEAARAYLQGRGPTSAVFAVNGPVEDDLITLSNSPWSFSIREAQQALGLQRLVVINDFVAQALAVPVLAENERRKLGGGEPVAQRTIGVIGPGTGLGVAALLWVSGGWLPMPSEGGHVSFAPHDEVDAAIADRLARRFDHVSNERMLAGPGLVNVAMALADLAGATLPPLQPKDVVDRAQAGTCQFCRQTIERYPALLGAAAGDLALMLLARGGVFIAGGVVAHLGEMFDVGRFRRAFVAKGRFQAYLERVPTYLVTRGNTGLMGAAALRLDP
jgi:glucokinase